MTEVIALAFKFGPWILTALAGVFALLTHANSKAKVAAANQKVAEAQTSAAQAQAQTAEVRDAEAQANTAAAQQGAAAQKERTDVESDVATLPVGSAAEQLRNEWSRPAEDAGRGTGSAGQNANR
ncbi:hypothetical protein [Paraburkholderia atlantica]|uniref:hypothetical protein n=1 Tax=Paraburkholderia atlantica TaxID=2654982 RepID=UPI00039FB0A8|nr:hypothetical protein [Paraburkholderia atlantica]